MRTDLFEGALEVFAPSQFLIKPARHDWEVKEARRLRRAVFCIEQGIFLGDDEDDVDAVAQTLVAATCLGGMPDQIVGTVRIHTSEAGLWWGSRLAVHPLFRRQGEIGSWLVRLAVGLARLADAKRFLAHVQLQNVALFEKLHWTCLAEVERHGRPHALMQAELEFYPAMPAFADGIVARPRSRA